MRSKLGLALVLLLWLVIFGGLDLAGQLLNQ